MSARRSTIPQASFPAASEALEAAFPERFSRDAGRHADRGRSAPGRTFEQSRRDTIRWGFDFTKPLQSKPPSQAAIAAFRERLRASKVRRTPPRRSGRIASPAARLTRRGPGGGGFRGFGGGGRLRRPARRAADILAHPSAEPVDDVTIADGVPKLDYLRRRSGQLDRRPPAPRDPVRDRLLQQWPGRAAAGQLAQRHDRRQLERRSATSRPTPTSTSGCSPTSARISTWSRSTPSSAARRSSFNVDNIFNNRPKVRGASGTTPLSYQPDLLEPIGRTVGITFRKLFIPRRFVQQRRQRPAS